MKKGLIPEMLQAAKTADYTQCQEVQTFIMELANGKPVPTHARAFLNELAQREALVEWSRETEEYRTLPEKPMRVFKLGPAFRNQIRSAIP